MEVEHVHNSQKNVSYLRARDPSILAWNHHISAVKINLNRELLQSTSSCATTQDVPQEDTDNLLKVYLRIKKTDNFKDLYEIVDNKTLLCKAPAGAQCVKNIRNGNIITKLFTFSKIFGSESNQADLFNGVVKEKILHLINGYNCSLLTYGASGSGKTFTIVGTPDAPGIVPRALEYLFRTLPQLSEQPLVKPTAAGGVIRLTDIQTCEKEKRLMHRLLKGTGVNIDRALHTRTYKAMQQQLVHEPVALLMDDLTGVSLGVWVSFAEIYNECIYDLLAPELPRGQPRPKLRLGCSDGKSYIKDLTCVSVSSGLQAYLVLQYGLHNLKYAPTSLNDHSSRSHSIFTIKLAQASDTNDGVGVSSFNFCDLAGSERMKKTNNVGERQKESNNINTSLLVLGRCVSLVRESQKHGDNRVIPFRESKLTQLFQKALLGQEAISMIVNINPTREMFDESQHVLNFSAIAKEVNLEQPRLVQFPKNNRFSQHIEKKNIPIERIDESELEELQEHVEYLRSELESNKMEAEEERQGILASYRELVEKVNKHGERRYKELQEMLTKRMQTSEENDQQENNKRHNTSIVIIDSSSEDEDEHQNNLAGTEDDCTDTQNKLDQELRKLTEDNSLLKATLEDAETAYVQLKSEFENDSKELNLQIIQKQEKINDLNIYLNALYKAQNKRFSMVNKENTDPFPNDSENLVK